MLKSHYGQVRVNNNLETRTFARDLFSLFVSPGCKTEMMTFHGDIFNFLGQSRTVRIIILFFLDRPHCAWSVLPRSWHGFLPAEISYLVVKRHIPYPYNIHSHSWNMFVCKSLCFCLCKFDITCFTNEFNMYVFLLVLWKCTETEEQVKRNELLSGRFEQDVS